VNRVVKGKVEQECNRGLALAAAGLTDGAGKTAAMDEMKAERAVLKNKTMAWFLPREQLAFPAARHGEQITPNSVTI
jgi:hypothetical protein